LAFLQPPAPFYFIALYGSGAVIARELVRRRRLGWWNLLILGAAFGVLEEGLVVTSWFNPLWPAAATLGDKGRVLDINWIWAVGLTAYHAVMSITIPVIVTERLFPAHAAEPWLGRAGLIFAIVVLMASSIFGLFVFGFLLFKTVGYEHPPGTYVVALLIFVALGWVGLGSGGTTSPTASTRPPSVWILRIFAFVLTVAWFVSEYVVPTLTAVAVVPIVALVAVMAVAYGAVGRWSRHQDWTPDHRFALASGVVGFFLALAPVVELGPHPPDKVVGGMIVFALVVLICLAWLSFRREAPRQAT
jgi:hypothetical protein